MSSGTCTWPGLVRTGELLIIETSIRFANLGSMRQDGASGAVVRRQAQTARTDRHTTMFAAMPVNSLHERMTGRSARSSELYTLRGRAPCKERRASGCQ